MPNFAANPFMNFGGFASSAPADQSASSAMSGASGVEPYKRQHLQNVMIKDHLTMLTAAKAEDSD